MRLRTVGLAAALLAGGAPVKAGQRLVLIGGGKRPPEALKRFLEYAGGASARILVVTWATEDPSGSFAALREDLAPLKPAAIDPSVSTAAASGWREQFLLQLASATGVFFTGGDQTRISDILKDSGVGEALRARYRAGTAFAGTSAGTAVMSQVMITGEGDFSVLDGAKVETKAGLGLLPAGIIVDQHFIKRQRENRLFSLVLENSGFLGLGIDEGTALAVEDGRGAQVVGPTPVLAVENPSADRIVVDVLRPGDRYDLKTRKRIKK